MNYPPLVTPTEVLAAYPGVSISHDDLAAVADDIRSAAGWHIAPEVAETVTLRSQREEALVLPTLKLSEVTAVRYWDGTAWAAVAGWDPVLGWDARACCVYRPGGVPAGLIQVDMGHGYPQTPPSLLRGVVALASPIRDAADVTAESVTARAVTYTENTPVRATRASFASAGALSRYKLGPRP